MTHRQPRGPATDRDAVAEQREKLAGLERHDREIRKLVERESALEAECIAADVALRAIEKGARPGLDHSAASEIAQWLAREHDLESALDSVNVHSARRGEDEPVKLERLRSGVEALSAWLGSDGETAEAETGRMQHYAHLVFLLVTVLIVVAAFTVHWVLLVLLVPVVGATSFITWSGQDASWRRAGARRQYDMTHLAPLAHWTVAAVEARRAEVEEMIASHGEVPDPPGATRPTPTERAELESTLAEARDRRQVSMRAAGLSCDSIDPDLRRWLVALGRSERNRSALHTVQATLAALRGEDAAVREELYRFVARHGESDQAGRADTRALAEKLGRLDGQDG